MKDRVPTYPGRVQLTPVAGQTNIYDMVMADQPTEAGTPPTKANLLTDETAASMGLSTDATVNDALQTLATEAIPISRGGSGRTTAEKAMYAFISGCSSLNNIGLAVNDYLPLYDYSAAAGKRVAMNEFAEFLGNKLNMVKIQSGSYVGTGVYGNSNNQCSITFTYMPKLVFIYCPSNGSCYCLPYFTDMNQIYAKQSGYATTYSGPVTWNGLTMSWYTSGNAQIQMNASGTTYNWYAFY